jgi:phosphate transport system substrate-binding protein
MKRVMLLALVLALCWAGGAAAAADILVIPGTGACEALLRDLAIVLNARQGQGQEVQVPPSVGSSGARRMVADGESQLGRIARPLGGKASEDGLQYLPFARDAVVFAVGAKVTVRGLSSDQLKAIFQGKISHWQAVGGPPGPIRLLLRQPGDVLLDAVWRYWAPWQAAFSPQAKVVHHDAEMVALLQKYKYSLGMVSSSSINGLEAALRPVALDNIVPSPANVAAGKYKLQVEYGLIYKDNLNDLARDFIAFLFSKDGKAIMKHHGVIPLERTPAQ